MVLVAATSLSGCVLHISRFAALVYNTYVSMTVLLDTWSLEIIALTGSELDKPESKVAELPSVKLSVLQSLATAHTWIKQYCCSCTAGCVYCCLHQLQWELIKHVPICEHSSSGLQHL